MTGGNSHDRRVFGRALEHLLQKRDIPSAVKQERNAKIYFCVGTFMTCLFFGLPLIGFSTNIWIGAVVLAAAFWAIIWAFWIWEYPLRFHVRFRMGTICLAAILYFGLVGKQMIFEYRREHPFQNKGIHEAEIKTYAKSWGQREGGRMYVTVGIDPPLPNSAPLRLLAIWRVVDGTVDKLEDTHIEKSSLWSASQQEQTIEKVVSQEFLLRAYESKSQIEVNVLLVPSGTDPDKITKISDAFHLGGKICAGGTFTPTLNISPKVKTRTESEFSYGVVSCLYSSFGVATGAVTFPAWTRRSSPSR
jgi:hypothetical protein